MESVILEHATNELASASTLHLVCPILQIQLQAGLWQSRPPRRILVEERPHSASYKLVLDKPVEVTKGNSYYLRFEIDSGALFISGASIANETDYDYGLPFRVDGYDAFGGIYRGLNLQVYWDDNADKLESFVTNLDQSDYIFLPTNHQYARNHAGPRTLSTYHFILP